MPADRSIKILLVEDSKVARKMAAKSLAELGFTHVVQAEDGDDAIAKLQAEPDVKLIISDWNMPNRDGFELLKWVRADERFKTVPFIMATARGEKKQMAAASDAGVSNFITKPFGPPELNELINATLSSPNESLVSKVQRREPKMAASGRLLLQVAHIQITDHLTLGVLKHLIEIGKIVPQHFELETRRMPSWNALQATLEKGEVDAVFSLAPIVMDLFGFGTPLKLVLFAHRNGSIAVRNAKIGAHGDLRDAFLGKTFYIPHELSIHHMLAHRFLSELGLRPGFAGKGDCDVFFEVVPPIKMPELLASNPDACGFLVAEPLGTKAIAEGNADLLFLSGEMWETHPCCVVAMRDEIVQEFPDVVQEFTSLLVEAGQFIQEKTEAAAEIAVGFLDPDGSLKLKVPVLKNVLREAQGIKTDNLFPVKADLDRIQQYMVKEMGLSSIIDLDAFVDDSFARKACRPPLKTPSMSDTAKVVARIIERRESGEGKKTNLNVEGSYLVFVLKNREYGIDILWVKEIIPMHTIRSVPHSHRVVRGIIDFRGQTIRVLDLRAKLGIGSGPTSDRTHIVVLQDRRNARSSTVGIIVDAVAGVIDVKGDTIADATLFKNRPETKYILGFAKTASGIKILLDSEQLFDFL